MARSISGDEESDPTQLNFKSQSDDSQRLWDVIEILDEKGGKYFVNWDGVDPATNKAWDPSWVMKSDCTAGLVTDWKEKKKARLAQKRKSSRQSLKSNASKATPKRPKKKSAPGSVASNSASVASGSRPSKRPASEAFHDFSESDDDRRPSTSSKKPPPSAKKRRRIDPDTIPRASSTRSIQTPTSVSRKSGSGSKTFVMDQADDNDDDIMMVEEMTSAKRRRPLATTYKSRPSKSKSTHEDEAEATEEEEGSPRHLPSRQNAKTINRSSSTIGASTSRARPNIFQAEPPSLKKTSFREEEETEETRELPTRQRAQTPVPPCAAVSSSPPSKAPDPYRNDNPLDMDDISFPHSDEPVERFISRQPSSSAPPSETVLTKQASKETFKIGPPIKVKLPMKIGPPRRKKSKASLAASTALPSRPPPSPPPLPRAMPDANDIPEETGPSPTDLPSVVREKAPVVPPTPAKGKGKAREPLHTPSSSLPEEISNYTSTAPHPSTPPPLHKRSTHRPQVDPTPSLPEDISAFTSTAPGPSAERNKRAEAPSKALHPIPAISPSTFHQIAAHASSQIEGCTPSPRKTTGHEVVEKSQPTSSAALGQSSGPEEEADELAPWGSGDGVIGNDAPISQYGGSPPPQEDEPGNAGDSFDAACITEDEPQALQYPLDQEEQHDELAGDVEEEPNELHQPSPGAAAREPEKDKNLSAVIITETANRSEAAPGPPKVDRRSREADRPSSQSNPDSSMEIVPPTATTAAQESQESTDHSQSSDAGVRDRNWLSLHESKNKEIEQLKLSLSTRVAEFERIIAGWEVRSKEHAVELASTRAQVDDLTRERNGLVKRVARFENQSSILGQARAELTNALKARDAAISESRIAQDSVSRLTATIADYEETTEDLLNQIKANNLLAVESQEMDAARPTEEEVDKLREEIKSLNEQVELMHGIAYKEAVGKKLMAGLEHDGLATELEEARTIALSLGNSNDDLQAKNADLAAEVALLRAQVDEKDHMLDTLQADLATETASLNALASKVDVCQQTDDVPVLITAVELDQLRSELDTAQKQKSVMENDFEYLRQRYTTASDAASSLGRENASLQLDAESVHSQAKYGVKQAQLHFKSEIERLTSELEHQRGTMSILLEKSARLDRAKRTSPDAIYLRTENQGLRETIARLAHEVLPDPEEYGAMDAHDIVNSVIDSIGAQLHRMGRMKEALLLARKERDQVLDALRAQEAGSPEDLREWLQSDVLDPSDASPVAHQSQVQANGQYHLPSSSPIAHNHPPTELSHDYLYVCVWHDPKGTRCDAEFQHKKDLRSHVIGQHVHPLSRPA